MQRSDNASGPVFSSPVLVWFGQEQLSTEDMELLIEDAAVGTCWPTVPHGYLNMAQFRNNDFIIVVQMEIVMIASIQTILGLIATR